MQNCLNNLTSEKPRPTYSERAAELNIERKLFDRRVRYFVVGAKVVEFSREHRTIK